jgi:MoxR-like ATPase
MSTPPPARSCTTCPSYASSVQSAPQAQTFGTPTTLDRCLRYGDYIGTHNSSPEQADAAAKRRAASCDSWGEDFEKSDYPTRIFFTRQEDDRLRRGPKEPAPTSCSACKNFIRPDTMMTSFGIPNGACGVLGIGIGPGEGRSYANNCSYGVLGFESTVQMDKLVLASHLQGNLTYIDHDGSVILGDTPSADPAERETDAPVSEEDEKCGIRAWRRVNDIEDATGERHIFLPVFDTKIFSIEEQAKIPASGDEEHPELYQDHQGLAYKMGVLWLHMNETPALNGVAGVGKTEAYRYMAYLMQVPFERLSITDSTELDDIAGRWVLEPDESTQSNKTRFEYGRLPKAWSKPNVVCIDEPNTGPPAVWQFIRPLTDNSKQMVIDMNKGERIDRHRFAFLGMAMNPSWDIRNVGTHQVADADGSRLMHIAVPPPTDELEREILVRRCDVDGYKIAGATLDAIMKIAHELRELGAQDDTLSVSFGTRQTIKVARLTRWFSLKASFRMAVADLVSPEEAERILAIVASHERTDIGAKGRKIEANW